MGPGEEPILNHNTISIWWENTDGDASLWFHRSKIQSFHFTSHLLDSSVTWLVQSLCFLLRNPLYTKYCCLDVVSRFSSYRLLVLEPFCLDGLTVWNPDWFYLHPACSPARSPKSSPGCSPTSCPACSRVFSCTFSCVFHLRCHTAQRVTLLTLDQKVMNQFLDVHVRTWAVTTSLHVVGSNFILTQKVCQTFERDNGLRGNYIHL